MGLTGRRPTDMRLKARRGKQRIASQTAIIAAVETETGISMAEMAGPPDSLTDEQRLARRLLCHSLRWFGGLTQDAIAVLLGLWPNSVKMDQRYIRLATQRTDRKSFRLPVKETLERIQFTCREMYRIEKYDARHPANVD